MFLALDFLGHSDAFDFDFHFFGVEDHVNEAVFSGVVADALYAGSVFGVVFWDGG